MAATRYLVMFRHINPITNRPITNDMSNEYKEDFYLIHDGHPYRNGDAAWESKINALLVDGNDANNVKFDMLFAYGGAEKVPRYSNYPATGNPSGPISGVPNGYPYVIRDTFVRITQTPWFADSTYGSLEKALEKCKTLANMVGLDNIKLIKIVPFDLKIKIV